MVLRLAVLWRRDRWTLLAPGASYDRYRSRQNALDAARRLAERAQSEGLEVEILVQDVGGELAVAPLHPPPPRDPPDQPAGAPGA